MGVWIRDPEESTMPTLNDKIKIMKITPSTVIKILRWMSDTFPRHYDPGECYVSNAYTRVPLMTFDERSALLQEVLGQSENMYFSKGPFTKCPYPWLAINADVFDVFKETLILDQEFEIVDDVFS